MSFRKIVFALQLLRMKEWTFFVHLRLFVYLFVYLFIYLEHEWGRGRERGKERESQADPSLNAEPHVGLRTTNREIMTWAETKSQTPNWLHHPGVPGILDVKEDEQKSLGEEHSLRGDRRECGVF